MKPTLKRKIVSMPDNKSLISLGMSSARQQINNSIYDVMINIGLILSIMGTRKDDLWYYHLESESIAVGEQNNEYFVFKISDNNSKMKIFHVKIQEHRVALETFQRGRWENILEAVAESVRIATEIGEVVDGKEKDKSK